jgi:MbtH protein
MNDETFTVVVNPDEQYSVWWTDRPLPAGWTALGFEGSRQECLDRIDEIWTDMRPRSVREAAVMAAER